MAADRAGSGTALAVVSAATFGTSGSFADSLLHAGWSPAAAVAVRVLLAAVVLTPVALRGLRGRWSALRREAASVTGYGLLGVAGCQFFYFQAVGRVPVGIALLLEYLGTVLVVGWMWARHGRRPTRVTCAGAALALIGLVLVLGLLGTHRVDPLGVLWGLGAAVGLAVYFVRSASGSSELPPLVTAWAGLGVGAVALLLLGAVRALPMRASNADVTLAGARLPWFVPVLGLSLVAAVVAYVTGIAAARRLGATLAGFVGLGEVLFAVLFAWLLLGQAPRAVQFGGGALVVAGVALVRLGELRRPQQISSSSAVRSWRCWPAGASRYHQQVDAMSSWRGR